MPCRTAGKVLQHKIALLLLLSSCPEHIMEDHLLTPIAMVLALLLTALLRSALQQHLQE